MSLREQERALFDLLFDRDLRDQFGNSPEVALAGYELNRAEREDFSQIRMGALETDARMRVYMLLAQLCRELPLSFALASALPQASRQFRELVDRDLLDVPVALRAAEYGSRLMDWVGADLDLDAEQQARMVALIGAETAMARSAGALRQTAENVGASAQPDVLPEDWTELPAAIAPHTCAIVVPTPYDRILDALCGTAGDDLWREIDQYRLTLEQVAAELEPEEPRLLVVRHFLAWPERCVPVLSQKRIEVSTGFAPLLRYLDGRNRIADILRQLEHSGAPGEMLPSIRSGFAELAVAGIVQFRVDAP